MLNRKNIFLIATVLIIAIIISIQIGLVDSSTGAIRVNRTSASDSNLQVAAGAPVNLYFGDSSIKWSGHKFYLFLSRDLATTISAGDYVYSPMISVAELRDSSQSYHSNNEGTWVVGNNWVNGTFASNMPAGKYSIKAFDFSDAETETDTGSVAVTDILITVTTRQPEQYIFQISPNEGSGGIPVQFSGSGYPSNVVIDIAYYDPAHSDYRVWRKETTDASGCFSFSAEIPDLGKSNQQGDNPETLNRIQFKTQYQGLAYNFAVYNQYARGIKSIGNQTANGIYGNNTNFVSTFKAKAGDTFTITGKWFHKGIIYVLLDSKIVMGTVTHSQWDYAIPIGSTMTNDLGHFDVTVEIPKSIDGGEHYIAIEDSDCTIIVKILITDGTLQISPSAGAGGANVQFTGSGYPASGNVEIKYRDGQYGSWNYWTTIRADASGNINMDFTIPDLKRSCYAGDYYNASSSIAFRSEVNGKIFAYTEYTQYARGLKQVGSIIATNLFGSSTDFTNYNLKVKPGDAITISGRYFHPGIIYVRWDGEAVVNTVTPDQWSMSTIIGSTIANSQGTFETTITIPTSDKGLHWVSIEDSQTNFVIRLPVESATSTPTPTPTQSSSPASPSKPKPTSSPSPSPNKLTPLIDLQCKSTPSEGGFTVEISGTCSNNNIGLADKAIQLYSSKNGGKTWEPLTLVNTNTEGKFNAVWISTTSGIFLIKAECAATTEYNLAVATVNLAIEPALEDTHGEKVFTVTSNSTISQLSFNSETSELSFTASGETGSTGFVSVNVPKTLIKDISNLKVYLDGNEITFNNSQEADAWIITIKYNHSTHTIIMNLNGNAQSQNNSQVTWIIIATIIVSLILITVATVITKKKKQHSQN
jgi:hypothetical protein